MLRASSAQGDVATMGPPKELVGTDPMSLVMARASWGPDGDKGEPMPREAVGTCSHLQDRLSCISTRR